MKKRVIIWWVDQADREYFCAKLGISRHVNVNGKTIDDVTPEQYAQLQELHEMGILNIVQHY